MLMCISVCVLTKRLETYLKSANLLFGGILPSDPGMTSWFEYEKILHGVRVGVGVSLTH